MAIISQEVEKTYTMYLGHIQNTFSASRRSSFNAAWNATPTGSCRSSRLPVRYVQYPKLIREADDDTLMSSFVRRAQWQSKPWYERLFDSVRAWIIDSDRRARRQNCFMRNQMWFFAALFLLLCGVIYVAQYGMPFQDWEADDLAMFIPKQYRGDADPVADIATPEPPAPRKPSSLESRLNQSTGHSGRGRRPTDPARR